KVKRVSELIAFCKSKLHETEEEVEKILKTIED
ncbi:MAG: exodeoxyribonuclease VII small subunit, partial [Odoribacter splanchnicus]